MVPGLLPINTLKLGARLDDFAETLSGWYERGTGGAGD